MLEVLKFEEFYIIKVLEENKKFMIYIIVVVDEGLLDLIWFKMFEIYEVFYFCEVLGVKIFDIFDDVIGVYLGSVENIFVIGGGDEVVGVKNWKVDCFKFVVSYIGFFELKVG